MGEVGPEVNHGELVESREMDERTGGRERGAFWQEARNLFLPVSTFLQNHRDRGFTRYAGVIQNTEFKKSGGCDKKRQRNPNLREVWVWRLSFSSPGFGAHEMCEWSRPGGSRGRQTAWPAGVEGGTQCRQVRSCWEQNPMVSLALEARRTSAEGPLHENVHTPTPAC